jgi:sulfoxide reductase heme-binding subunit YedZ
MMLWEIARASAMIAFCCYTLVVVWGILLAGRGFRPAAPQMAFHRFLSSLGLAAVATHITTLMLDSYAKLHWPALAGVGTTPARAMGAAALWLTIALPLSIRLKKAGLISTRVWRALHYMGYTAWVLALVHGIASGSDTRSPFALAMYGTAGALVAAAAWWRWLERPEPQRVRP